MTVKWQVVRLTDTAPSVRNFRCTDIYICWCWWGRTKIFTHFLYCSMLKPSFAVNTARHCSTRVYNSDYLFIQQKDTGSNPSMFICSDFLPFFSAESTLIIIGNISWIRSILTGEGNADLNALYKSKVCAVLYRRGSNCARMICDPPSTTSRACWKKVQVTNKWDVDAYTHTININILHLPCDICYHHIDPLTPNSIKKTNNTKNYKLPTLEISIKQYLKKYIYGGELSIVLMVYSRGGQFRPKIAGPRAQGSISYKTVILILCVLLLLKVLFLVIFDIFRLRVCLFLFIPYFFRFWI